MPAPRRCARVAALVAGLLVSCSPGRDVAGEVRGRFEELHRRLYDVYTLDVDRDELWSFLAQSFDGEELTAEYVEHFTALRRMASERTSIRVLEVDYEELAVRREGRQWLVDADWSVGGVVSHQSHRHPRINRYRATYQLALASGSKEAGLADLRIVETTLRSLERVSSTRGVGFPLDELPSSARGSLSLSDLLRSGALEESPATAADRDSPSESLREEPRQSPREELP
jgi:hypothetical protein